jgi:uncharacterized metal-binding protein YceD (DUF177 family)
MNESTALRVADLSQNAPTPFEIRPESAALTALAEELGLNALRKLRFAGEIRASGKRDWVLDGVLGATVVQDCVVTLEPVTTRIDQKVRRQYLAAYETPEGDEVEMPEDDGSEPLGSHIDPFEVMIEALSLAIPAYPRKDGQELGEAVFTAPGIAPMRDEDTKPFAALSALKDQLKDKG